MDTDEGLKRELLEQKIKYKRLTLTKEDIIPIRDAYQKEVPDRCFDSVAIESVIMNQPDIVSSIQEVIRKYQVKYNENLELLAICEMALLYLKEKEKKEERDE